MSCPDVDPDNDQYGEPNSPDVGPPVEPPLRAPKPASPAEKAAPSVLQKLQKWGDYEAFGNVVQPSLFIPMKTPLSQAILDEWTLPEAPKHSLTISSLLQQQHFRHRQVGMIIDLSNHETLYADDLPPFVQYEHVQLVAKVFPDQSQVDEVIDLAEKYWAANPTQHIAIHCAYGFNRTGFVVCSYLVQALGMSVNEALAAFEQARPPGVKHQRFVNELHRRFDNHRWGSGFSTVGSETAGSVGGFSHPRRSFDGSVGSMQSDFKGVAEHLQKQQQPSRQSDVGTRPPRSPLSGYTLLSHEPGSKQVPDPELGGTPTQRAMSVPSGLCDPSTSVGSENESLGLNQRAALSELRKVRGASTISEFEDAGNLMTNPSLGFGVSELTTALRQQRPRRAINMLPAVSSAASIQEAGSGAGSSPGITSPFAAVANSPREDANGRPAGETAFEAEQKHQELQQHETAQQPSADAAIGLQAGSDGIDQYSDAVDYQTAELQPDLDKNDESNNVHDVDSGSQQEANMQRTSSSDGSMQNHRRKGRPKCIVM
ncbi:hypothetical protein ABBQ38_009530 [Trebouxia sp. C0009 RCD-2024]